MLEHDDTAAPAPAAPKPRRARGWAARRYGEFAAQYDTPGGAVLTVIRFSGDLACWECQCGESSNPVREYADQTHAQATAGAEAHAAACTKPALCRRCCGTGLAHPR